MANKMNNIITRQIFKKIRKASKKIIISLLPFIIPFLILILLCSLVVDFFWCDSPITANDTSKKTIEIKNNCIELTDIYNIADCTLDGNKVKDRISDAYGKDNDLYLKWSDLYAIALFDNNININDLSRSDLEKILKKIAPKFKYITAKTTVVLERKVKDKDGKETGEIKKEVISEKDEILLTEADTIFGQYKYTYEKGTEVKEDENGKWTTTHLCCKSNELIGEKYARFEKFIKDQYKLSDTADLALERESIMEESKALYGNCENLNWLLGNGFSMDFIIDTTTMATLDPQIASAIASASQKYKIPPWLIMGYIQRESSFQIDIMSCDDLGHDVKVSSIMHDMTYMNHPYRSLGLMQVVLWADQCSALGYDPVKEALNPMVQVEVGVNELWQKIKTYSHVDTKTATNIDWKGDGWKEQLWRGCQGYNGLPGKTIEAQRRFAFTRYLMRSDGTGVFQLADKYKAQTTNSSGTQKGTWPLINNFKVSSPFGMRVHPITGKYTGHKGIDIPAPKGTPVLSASSGAVVEARCMNGYGNTVVVRDGNHDYLYAHMSAISVKTGQVVKIGTELGKVGSTGNSTGNHLHFGVSNGPWSNGNWIDPLSVISK